MAETQTLPHGKAKPKRQSKSVKKKAAKVNEKQEIAQLKATCEALKEALLLKEAWKKKKQSADPKEEAAWTSDEAALVAQLDTLNESSAFDAWPLSTRTKEGLKAAHFVEMTDIQKATLLPALAGRDILGAAKTGSGKTLAFLVPLLDVLYRQHWNNMDGLGALIITPTRELALQIFEVLQKVGAKHDALSAGLLIGGKNVKQEAERIAGMTILVATPGRLLQHMDETPNWTTDHLQLLVLDEADRILDMGFASAMDAILANLPKERQTFLFSATQTKSVKDLARLSLASPEYIAIHEKSATSTPKGLTQHLLYCDLPMKLDVLWSFVKTHLKTKGLVFLSSCKQIRFIFEAFCKFQPGVPLLCLHGQQSQMKRQAVFQQFCKMKHAFLFATDIAARGLDFPAVDWVVQVDCPEDVDTYIHRVGRTARYGSKGNALLMLLPSEKEMQSLLEKKKIPIGEIKINPAKQFPVKKQLMALCAERPDLKYLAQKAFISYMRSIYLHSNKDVFDVTQLPADAFAESLGLPGAPKLKFVNRLKESKNQSKKALNAKAKAEKAQKKMALEAASAAEPKQPEAVRTRMDKLFAKQNTDILSTHYAKLQNVEEDDEDVFQLARQDHTLENVPEPSSLDNPSVRDRLKTLKKYRIKHPEQVSQKVIFDDDGNAHLAYQLEDLSAFEAKGDVLARGEQYTADQKVIMGQQDKTDKSDEKERIRERKRKRKEKERLAQAQEAGDSEEEGPYGQVTLGRASEDEEEEEHKKAKREDDYQTTDLLSLKEQEALLKKMLAKP